VTEAKYSIVYADPPWDYKGQKQHAGVGKPDTGAAVSHYDTMPIEDIKSMGVGDIVDNDASLLFLWSSSPHLPQALDVMYAWGFAWATVAFVWDKQKVNPGFYTMSQVELCLVGKMGKIPQPRGTRNTRQLISEERGVHSAKPAEVRTRIEQMFPTQSKIELFARDTTPGWDVWGDGVGKTEWIFE
jgi:N6-adenosine-specific RNA methylase IME4